jgi:hypothetical protein
MISWRRSEVQSEKVILKKDLMILLNEIYLSEKPRFSVRFPFYDLNLFKIDLTNYHLNYIVTENRFNEKRRGHIPESEFLRADLPRYTDFRDCLLTSTFLPFANIDVLKTRLFDLSETIKGPYGRSKPLYLGLDTNLLYFKFFSRYFPMRDSDGEIRVHARDFRVTISDMIKEEIDSNIKFKYRASNLTKMKKKFGLTPIVDEFFNASARKTRVAKSAQNELSYILGVLEAERAEATSSSEDKEERDRIIAKSYSNFEKHRNGEVMLLTADEDMAYHAKNANLLYETLLLPHKVPVSGQIPPFCLVDLLYDLAITFGVIRLQGTGITIFGEWKGKGLTHYSNEGLKLIISKECMIKDDFERDLRIAEKIDSLS